MTETQVINVDVPKSTQLVLDSASVEGDVENGFNLQIALRVAAIPTAGLSFPERCILAMHRGSVTQLKLAAAVGVSQPALCDWLNEKERFPANRQQQVAELLGLEL